MVSFRFFLPFCKPTSLGPSLKRVGEVVVEDEYLVLDLRNLVNHMLPCSKCCSWYPSKYFNYMYLGYSNERLDFFVHQVFSLLLVEVFREEWDNSECFVFGVRCVGHGQCRPEDLCKSSCAVPLSRDGSGFYVFVAWMFCFVLPFICMQSLGILSCLRIWFRSPYEQWPLLLWLLLIVLSFVHWRLQLGEF